MKALTLLIAMSMVCLLAGCSTPPVDDTVANMPDDIIVTEDINGGEDSLPQSENINIITMENTVSDPHVIGDKLVLCKNDGGVISVIISDLKYADKTEIPVDGDYNTVADVIEGEGDVLCRISFSRYDENGDIVLDVADIYTDLTMSEPAPLTESSFYIIHGEHKVGSRDISLVDAETGELLVEGVTVSDSFGTEHQYQEYVAPIDGDRFIYRTVGYESVPGFGIYDYSEKTASYVPNSEDLWPLGAYEGYIYSQKADYYGFGTAIYKTSLDTLETELAFEYPFENDGGIMVRPQMSPSGEYILLVCEHTVVYEDGSYTPRQTDLYKLLTSDGSVAWQTSIPDITASGLGFFIDEDTYLLYGGGLNDKGDYSSRLLLEISLG